MLTVQHEAAKVNNNYLEKSRDDGAARSHEDYLKDAEKSHARNCEGCMKDIGGVMLTVQQEAAKVTT